MKISVSNKLEYLFLDICRLLFKMFEILKIVFALRKVPNTFGYI